MRQDSLPELVYGTFDGLTGHIRPGTGFAPAHMTIAATGSDQNVARDPALSQRVLDRDLQGNLDDQDVEAGQSHQIHLIVHCENPAV